MEPTRSSFPDSVQHANRFGTFLRSRKSNSNRPRPWKPPALHPATLSIAIAIPLALILTLVLLLRRSQRDNGILFAPDINELPLSRTFMYQYFPTVLAVIFSIFWAWIDLETKRLEPYYQLSQKDGALGKDSLLLTYPSGFVPLIPIKAFRQRHWSVFWASSVLLLVTWGLIPTQAGIFSIERVTVNSPASFNLSLGSMSLDKQATSLTLSFAKSAYRIITYNETLPPFMTRNYTLAPFIPSTIADAEAQDALEQQWTAPTTLYSVDLSCEPAIPSNHSGITGWNNTGCWVSSFGMGNQTIDMRPNTTLTSFVKPFSTQYIGYWNKYGYANYYLSSSCPIERNHTLFAAFARNKERETDPANNVTAIFCEPTYYSQKVNATVDGASKLPTQVIPLGPKLPLNDTNLIFNTTWLEMQLSGGLPDYRIRQDELPNEKITSFAGQIATTNLSFVGDRQPLAGFSTFIAERPLEDFLDWKILARSYADSYRLLFARVMVDVLDNSFQAIEDHPGTRVLTTNAVVLQPVFTYIVVGFLCVITVATAVLLYLSARRMLDLVSDPCTIGTVMGIVADSKALLQDFGDLDCFTIEQIQEHIHLKQYRLIEQAGQVSLLEDQSLTNNRRDAMGPNSTSRTVSAKTIDRPVRPKIFSLWMSVLLVVIFVLLAAVLATLFIKAQTIGLPLPSKDKFVQNLLENYIPTAIATLIEPLWVLINRLLCLLQPMEELQGSKAKAKDSIDLNYSSLPPQLVLFKALRAHHFVLAIVCSMALLANVLSVTFAGLFNHDVVAVFESATFRQPFSLSFVPINGSIGPSANRVIGDGPSSSGAFSGGDGQDQFYILDANLTKGAPLTSWTDGNLFFLPFTVPEKSGNITDNYELQSETTTLGAELECEMVDLGDLRFRVNDPYNSILLNKTVTTGNIQAECSSNIDTTIAAGSVHSFDGAETLCQTEPSALELVLTLDALNSNATQDEKDLCGRTLIFGWARRPEGTCKTSGLSDLTAENLLFVQCQPRLMRGLASVRVNPRGLLVEPSEIITPVRYLEASEEEAMFKAGPSDLIAQSNRYIFQSALAVWHNDTFSTDFFSYFVRQAANSTGFLDPKQAVPVWEDIKDPLQKAYASLFAIWLGINKEHLLVPRSDTDFQLIKGWRVVEEERIFLSTALFSIALGILCTYALVIGIIYLRRPGEYLARLPTSLASIIALFASSTAVQEMGYVSGLQKKARAEHFTKLNNRYGYGSYVGTDGRVHIGIEKAPFVRPWKKVNSSLD